MTDPPGQPSASAPTPEVGSRWRLLRVGVAGVVAAVVVTVAVIALLVGHRSAAHSRRAVGHRASLSSGPATGRLAGLEAVGVARIHRFAALGLPIYCAGPHGNAVAFTFDDGPGPYTYLALRKLSQARERATFFVVGRSMHNFPGWIGRETKVAAIGDHTYTHPELPFFSAGQIYFQLNRTRQMIEQSIGQPVALFRPPYGAHNATVDETARQLGLLEILWSVDSRDSLGADWAGIIRNVEAGLHPGAIILMHENRGQTIRALTTLLPELQRRHLRSVSLPELFATDPPSVAQVRRGVRGCGVTPPHTSGS